MSCYISAVEFFNAFSEEWPWAVFGALEAVLVSAPFGVWYLMSKGGGKTPPENYYG